MATRPERSVTRPEPYLGVVRALVETYFAFLARDSVAIRAAGLTPSQFDVVATLGNTKGMTCRALSEQTLVTKGTLTGVLDRLESRGIVRRSASREDRRSIHVRLTPKGDDLFRSVFPAVIAAMKPYFDRALGTADAAVLRRLLLQLKASFDAPIGASSP